MEIKFNQLTLQNFKSHKDLVVKFGDLTKILADNAKGKSSIGEAITFLLYGNDLLGSKLDPSPITYQADNTLVTLRLIVDDGELLLGREIAKGRNKFYVNEVPSKATEFNEVVEKLFDKDLFLSLFNPSYFFTLHWEKQRQMILKYTTAPANKEVLKELPKPQSDKLAILVKKHSLEDLDKIHRSNKTKLDKQYIAAQSRTKTLREQLEQNAPTVPLDSLNVELNQLVKERNSIEAVTDKAQTINGRINILNNQINVLTQERDEIKDQFNQLKSEQIQDTCRVCNQTLQDEAIKAVEAEKEQRIQQVKSKFQQAVDKRKALEEELKTLEYVDVSEQLEKARLLQEKINPIEYEISKYREYKFLEEQVIAAEANEKETLESLNESIFILDAIKDFKAKEAELQVKKVQDLFENLSIKLFEEVKTTGENKPTFVVQMDGKDYMKLSFSEQTRAGLEIRDVLSEQSDIIAPCFVDNAETITKFKEPNGQLIISRVVADKELEVVAE
ncbi:AAA family ATPase [Lysinibacillus sphaericus]|uniref:AAA family ATPase n=1 Tax=Lysinibacillus sphaericus TaxID=1421 RepID=UPI002E1B3C64|nr:AAA family ATPase [Lysinibacillus sphaericus]MED4545074.1 ATPase [Lysinibacillus sphaericus]